MARNIGPNCRLCRREGIKLFLKAERCYSSKCSLVKRETVPGQLKLMRSKLTEYGLRLRAKQKLKRYYGLMEAQFRRFFEVASRQKAIPTGEKLVELLERRLDNVLYRLGFAGSRALARQLIVHGHIYVDGRKVYSPSYITKVGQEIKLTSAITKSSQIEEAIEILRSKNVPDWLEYLTDGVGGKVIGIPKRNMVELPINEQLVVEFYSR
ncbi:MAG: 30S ribosomal protein S4 [candidate division WS2 bacterium]|uniref:Small ribosomal subunit protein uS4 n=1 Tax=Psychracetigena formicireducens TaxID=2986056 RepID=A0A9E2BGX0_PSYF1|nr:30S ribosomal protein S4 [Candidatus Psychracetigena formicireducens]MBT9144682.1 30S ribosomal protein S4 [Candidatus Psychracetigena formicireducens]